MSRRPCLRVGPALSSAILLLTLGSILPAQQNPPHLAYALPAGGRQGTNFQVTLGGQFLQNASAVYISGDGIRATLGEYARPMNGMQATQLRDRMQELQKLPMDAAVRQEMIDVRTKLLIFNSVRAISPVLAETVALQVSIAPGAALGRRELRLTTPQGLSNPLVFCVGQLPEYTATESIDVVPPAPNQSPQQVQIVRPPTDMEIILPAIVNGRIRPGLPHIQAPMPANQFTPGQTARYRFHARQGQQLVIAAAARDLLPYLADAVPGWFQAVLTLHDAQGKELAYDDDYRFHPDPVIHFQVPREGDYDVEIRDALYRGREDFVYRIAVGELPFVTGAFPLGGPAGAKTSIALTGWNLSVNRVDMDARNRAPGIYPLPVSRDGLSSTSVTFMVDSLPETFEKEPNDTPAAAQRVKLPIVVNGRIGQPGDWDVFAFQGAAGQAIVAEVFARRLDSPLDSVLRLADSAGKQIALNDDYEDKAFGLETHHADSRIITTLPGAGVYYLYVGDTESKGGPEYAYRLRLAAPRPDFDLRVTPSAINAGPGMTVPITVHALRKDGFTGEIALALKDAPRGFTLSGGLLPAGMDEVRLTITAPLQLPGEPIVLNVEGRAAIEGGEVVHPAVPADNMMQAFAYWHLVPADALRVAIGRGPAFRTPIKVMPQSPLKLPAGGEVRIRVQVTPPPNPLLGKIEYELSEPPAGITLKDAAPVHDGTELVLECDAAKAKPGLRGNLIVALSAERTPPAGSPQTARQRVTLGAIPALPFEIVKR